MGRLLVNVVAVAGLLAGAGCREDNPLYQHGVGPDAAADAPAAAPPDGRTTRDGAGAAADAGGADAPSGEDAPILTQEDGGREAPADAGSEAGSETAPDAARPGVDGPAAFDWKTDVVGYWKLDDGAGKTVALDSSGQGNHGAVENVAVATAWVGGRVGGALDLPGGNPGGGVRIRPSTTIDGVSRALTIAVWVHRPRASAGFASLVSRQAGSGFREVFNLSFLGDKVRFFTSPTDGDSATVESDRPAPTGRWVHIAVTWDGATARLYQDGVDVGSASYAGRLLANANPVYIGVNKNGAESDESFVGRIDEVLIYARALPPAMIALLAAGASPLLPY